MPIQWFATPYIVEDASPKPPSRTVSLENYRAQVTADGGGMQYFECGGGPTTHYPGGTFGATCGIAVAKVSAKQATLNAINADSTIEGIPGVLVKLTDPMSNLTTVQLDAFLQVILPFCGYATADINTNLLGLSGNPTLAQQETTLASLAFQGVLDYLNTHRYTVVWDSLTNALWCDGRTMTEGVQTGLVSKAVPPPDGPEAVDQGVGQIVA